MKLKKILATATAVLTLGSVCALTACGGSDGETGEELTKEEWIAAFSEESFANMRFDGVEEETKYFVDDNGKESTYKTKLEITIINADGIYYLKKAEKSVDSSTKATHEYYTEIYYTVVDGEDLVYSYDKNTNSWKEVPHNENLHYYIEDFEDYEMYFFADLYDECPYDSKAGGYIWDLSDEDDGEIYSVSAILKFKDKKVCAMIGESTWTLDDEVIETGSYTYKFTYGRQSLTLPNVD